MSQANGNVRCLDEEVSEAAVLDVISRDQLTAVATDWIQDLINAVNSSHSPSTSRLVNVCVFNVRNCVQFIYIYIYIYIY